MAEFFVRTDRYVNYVRGKANLIMLARQIRLEKGQEGFSLLARCLTGRVPRPEEVAFLEDHARQIIYLIVSHECEELFYPWETHRLN